ncbi:MAG: hypothetical protein R6V03_03490 [Kiritimatiellia bacterium]
MKIPVAVITCGLILAGAAHGAEQKSGGLEAELREVVLRNLEATENEDLEKLKGTIHTASPARLTSVQATKRMLAYFDFDYELLYFSYVGSDGKYALARGRQKTVKTAGPAFQDNVLDSIYVFRREEGEWKLWMQSVLERELVKKEPAE